MCIIHEPNSNFPQQITLSPTGSQFPKKIQADLRQLHPVIECIHDGLSDRHLQTKCLDFITKRDVLVIQDKSIEEMPVMTGH